MKYSILVPDDKYDFPEFDLKAIFEKAFPSLMYGFTFVRSPYDALEIMKYDQYGIDLVLLDIRFNMAINGVHVLDKIKKMDPDLPVIMMTGVEEINQAFEIGKYQPSSYIPKHEFQKDISELVKRVEKALSSVDYRYDREHMRRANLLSTSYDSEETERPATVAFYKWEDEQVLKLVDDLVASKERIRCLDVGCGTGRFERLFARKVIPRYRGKDIQITGLDFSGGMLLKARENLKKLNIDVDDANSNVKVERGIAEKLPFEDPQFDLVILGFGIPSYTKYHLSLQEAIRVLKKGGIALFTVYNDEALYYRNWGDSDFNEENPLAAQINRSERPYKLRVGPDFSIDVTTFTTKEICDRIEETTYRGTKFRILRDTNGNRRAESFPTLYSSLKVSSVQGSGAEDDLYPCSKFNKDLFKIDSEFSRILTTGGYYITVIAQKV